MLENFNAPGIVGMMTGTNQCGLFPNLQNVLNDKLGCKFVHNCWYSRYNRIWILQIVVSLLQVFGDDDDHAAVYRRHIGLRRLPAHAIQPGVRSRLCPYCDDDQASRCYHPETISLIGGGATVFIQLRTAVSQDFTTGIDFFNVCYYYYSWL